MLLYKWSAYIFKYFICSFLIMSPHQKLLLKKKALAEAAQDSYDSEKDTHKTHMRFEEFLNLVLDYNLYGDARMIKKAFYFAHDAHKGQTRESGETYFIHPLSVAEILIKLRADTATICAALLHDCVEDTSVPLSQIKKEFNDEVAGLVEGLTKTNVSFPTKEEYNAENLRKILLATMKDIRVMLIKLADRLHNMRTLRYFRDDKQKRIAQETLNIYAPIAHKLGIRFIKGELEDLSLKVLDPESYVSLRSKIAQKRKEREQTTDKFITKIKNNLAKRHIKAQIAGRAKYFYSIYQKMKRENKAFNEIYDLIAIRVIVKTRPECYAALAVIHELWKPMPGRFKDYIAMPKHNGYQSLHTSVIGDHGRILEIQIRTRDMHLQSEEGIAAHWRYKGEGEDKKKYNFDRKITWGKQFLEWKRTSKTAKEFVETLKIDLFQNEIVVFTPKGDPISLPEESTPVDFAYAVHTNIGNQCGKVMVNGQIAPLDQILNSGDIVKVVTTKDVKPTRGWLSFVKTSKARSKIKATLNIKTDSENRQEEKVLNLHELVEVSGKKAPLKFSKCCVPQYKDPILAFYTKDKKITVHKKDCPNTATLDASVAVPVQWKEHEGEGVHTLSLTVKDRLGLLVEILNVVSKAKINVQSINTRAKKDKIIINLTMKLPEEMTIKQVIKELKRLKDIVDFNEK
jgi:GTP diphosphokinase / guanosine-3',5'-bis(diphosphate) 3'-diphosphatase